MVAIKENDMGRFSVEIELANYKDLNRADDGLLERDKVRRTRLRAVVDTGATRLVIPEAVAQQLGLETTGEVAVRYADGRREPRPLATGIHLTYGGRSGLFSAVVEPQRDSALIGAIVLEELDLIPDCTRSTLEPRDPKQIISEAE
jgi:predicted aspartyl protease